MYSDYIYTPSTLITVMSKKYIHNNKVAIYL